MQPALRLTEAPSLKLHPEDLIHQLERSFVTFDTLLKDLNVSIEDLDETLNAPETSQLIKLKTQVACLQVQLIALRAAPHCTARLVSLTNETEKPEVGRRAATTLLHIAGIATYTSAQSPNPPAVPPPAPKTPEETDPPTSEEARHYLEAVGFVLELQRKHNISLVGIDHKNLDPIIAAIRPFLPNPPFPKPKTD